MVVQVHRSLEHIEQGEDGDVMFRRLPRAFMSVAGEPLQTFCVWDSMGGGYGVCSWAELCAWVGLTPSFLVGGVARTCAMMQLRV